MFVGVIELVGELVRGFRCYYWWSLYGDDFVCWLYDGFFCRFCFWFYYVCNYWMNFMGSICLFWWWGIWFIWKGVRWSFGVIWVFFEWERCRRGLCWSKCKSWVRMGNWGVREVIWRVDWIISCDFFCFEFSLWLGKLGIWCYLYER